MSDHKSNGQYNAEDTQALYELLKRLELRDAMLRNAAAWEGQNDLLLSEVPEEDDEEDLRLDPVPYQPELILAGENDADAEGFLRTMSESDITNLLLLDEGEEDAAYGFAEHQPDDDLPEPPTNRRNPFAVLWGGFCSNFPRKGDSTGTKVRKCGFLTSLLVMLAAIVYLVVDLLIIPAKNEQLKKELIALYHPEKSNVVITKEEAQKGGYPDKMLASFVDLYQRNKEVRGWISYHATGNKDFLDIEYPIVYSGDNTKYLRKDFDGNKNRNGTLFFDQNSKLDSYKDQNRSLIVYGHNMASGQMFAGLNKLMGSVSNARAAATLTMSTLYRSDEYKVFAVILTDESDKKAGRYFNTRRTSFADEEDFLNYIDQMRERSLFDYEDAVDVKAGDEILVLSTCTGKTSAHVKDGRLVVVARRVRDGEDPEVNTSKIVKNTDVIMPYYWYINQKKDPHKYYLQHGLQNNADLTTQPESTGSTTAATTVGGTTVTTTTGTGTDTTLSTDVDGTTTSPDGDETTTTIGGGTTASTNASTSATASSATGSGATSSTTQTSATNKPECNHQYDNDCDTTCNVDGCGDVRETKHIYDGCDDTKCNVCNAERDAVAHTYDNACDKDCNVCKKEREVEDHHYGEPVRIEPTCDKNGSVTETCTECGDTHTVEELLATGEHTYDENGVCTGCGKAKSTEATE